MAQRLFIFKNNFLSECLQGRRLLCQFSAEGCTNMTASSSLSDFAASIFIVSPYCEVYPIFSKNTPLQHPLSVYQRKPFCECKSRYSFFPSSFSPLPLLPLPLPPPPCVCVCECVPDDEHFEKKCGIWMHEQIYLGTCLLKERKAEKSINGRGTTQLLETALLTSVFPQCNLF